MIVDKLDVSGSVFRPAKAQAKLSVHSDGMLTRSIAAKRFKPVAWRIAHRIKSVCSVQLPNLALSDLRKIRGKASPWDPAFEKLANALIPEAHDRQRSTPTTAVNVSRNDTLLKPAATAHG